MSDRRHSVDIFGITGLKWNIGLYKVASEPPPGDEGYFVYNKEHINKTASLYRKNNEALSK